MRWFAAQAKGEWLDTLQTVASSTRGRGRLDVTWEDALVVSLLVKTPIWHPRVLEQDVMAERAWEWVHAVCLLRDVQL